MLPHLLAVAACCAALLRLLRLLAALLRLLRLLAALRTPETTQSAALVRTAANTAEV
ncbi:hypothetical protein [Subtercola sp. RTI3]|uniref:hypothetical protein n=1 Tax=Subtercola sp. RTI3 TaxID=3048639 RepID=UPI002B23A66E|nr:hypothetical protein [Subtercola sp. RTI3]MEA9987048.1 hypothetical protein [Subtercola sp. RTI3]